MFENIYLKASKLEEKYKYFTYPLIYCVTYDKYYRKDIYDEILGNENFDRTKIFKDFKSQTNLKNVKNYNDFLILMYYNDTYKVESFGTALFMFSLLINKLFIRLTLKNNKKGYIFLDNNRYIYNNLNSFNFSLNKLIVAISILSFTLGTVCILFGIYSRSFKFLDLEKEFIESNETIRDKYLKLFNY